MVIRLNVNSECNLRCKHCYYWENVGFSNDVMQIDLAKKIVDDIYSIWDKDSAISLLWWEPLMYKHLFELLEYIRFKWITKKIVVATNWLLIWVNDLIKFKELQVHLVISIEWNEEYHDLIRWKWTYKKVEKFIFDAYEYRVPITLNMTLNKFNLKYIPYLVTKYWEYIFWLNYSRYIPFLPNSHMKELDKKDYLVVDYYLTKYKKTFFVTHDNFLILKHSWFKKINTKKWVSIKNVPSLYILPEWWVFPSRSLTDFKLWDISKENLQDILNKWELLNLYNPDKLKWKCWTCKYKIECWWNRWAAYFYTKDVYSEDPHCPYF